MKSFMITTTKPTEMTNNKQQTALEIFWNQLPEILPFTVDTATAVKLDEAYQQAKEKYEHEMCEFAAEYAQYELEQSKEGIKGAMVSMCAWTFFKNRRK
jgi:hypothetical protein